MLRENMSRGRALSLMGSDILAFLCLYTLSRDRPPAKRSMEMKMLIPASQRVRRKLECGGCSEDRADASALGDLTGRTIVTEEKATGANRKNPDGLEIKC